MESSGVKVVPPGGGKTVGVAGGLYSIKAAGEDTSGRYALIEMLIPPGNGPPVHIHSREVEAFYILEGELALQVGERRLLAGAGAFVLAPMGIAHSFKNESASSVRGLLIVAPAGLEKFFEEVSQPVAAKSSAGSAPSEVTKIQAAGATYGLFFPELKGKP